MYHHPRLSSSAKHALRRFLIVRKYSVHLLVMIDSFF
ncbi:hypothetical protein RSC2_03455 [Bacillus paralicheniformis]|nr:hypothetical protein RSC1_01600 [Bacillus paralicheniformis]BCE11659.1 hypothetical protein RSC2_03455 [Bacillus paralicheniformis]